MFAICPQEFDFIDAELFDTETEAFDSALDWSVELMGDAVIVFKQDIKGNWSKISKVFS